MITSISLISTQNYYTSEPKKKRLSKLERSKMSIEYPLNEIVIGLLLGAGHIQRRSLNDNSRFIYGQSSLRKHHFNYFNHVFELFQPYLSEDFKIKERSFIDKRTTQKYCSINFATLSLPCFNLYRNLFYSSEKIKIVPANIQKLLTPRGLAYWIMVDGSIQNKGLHLNTYNFTNEEVLNLKRTLENMFVDIAK